MGLLKSDLKDYRKVKSSDEKVYDEPQKENELKVGPVKSANAYISTAIDVLDKGEHRSIVLLGRGQTISKVVSIAEVLKRRVPGLHQLAETESTEVVDVYEPKDASKNLEKKEVSKYVCGLSITLSLDQLDTSKPGYQEPLPEDEVAAEDKERRTNRTRINRQPATRGRGAASLSGRGTPSGRGGDGRGGDWRGASKGRGTSAAKGAAKGSAKGGFSFKSGSKGRGSKGSRGGIFR